MSHFLLRRCTFTLPAYTLPDTLIIMFRNPSNLLITTVLSSFCVVAMAPLSFATGHLYLVKFLGAQMLKKSKSKVAGESSPSVASTNKQGSISALAKPTEMETVGESGNDNTTVGGVTTMGNTTMGDTVTTV